MMVRGFEMMVFECVACGAALTAPVRQVALPDHADHEAWDGGGTTSALLESGTYAAGPEQIAVAPADVRDLSWIEGRFEGSCCGLAGRRTPNLACACGREVAARVDDCDRWRVVWLQAGAVRAVGTAEPVAVWETFDWGTVLVDDADLSWHDRVRVSAGLALAHVLIASEGAPVAVPDGPVADTFRRHLDELLPPGPPARTLALTGPDMPGEADIVLVPRHPQTGEPWPAAGTVVPISAELWKWLAHEEEHPVIPATGGRWPYLTEDPLPRRPKRVELSWWTMRLEVRSLPRVPWLPQNFYDR